MQRINQKGFSVVEALIILVVLGILGFAGYFVWSKNTSGSGSDVSVQKKTVEKAREHNSTAKKTYCMPLEKLCFEYPDTWDVVYSTEKLPIDNATVEKVTVRNQKQEETILVQTAFPQVGGGCDESDQRKQYVVTSEATRAKTVLNSARSEWMTDTMHAVQFIYTHIDAQGQDQYVPRVMLSTDKNLTHAGEYMSCPNTVYVDIMPAVNTFGSNENQRYRGSLIFNLLVGEDQSSLSAAKAVLLTDDYVTAYEIAKSVYYE